MILSLEVYPLLSTFSRNMLSLCYALSLILAYCIAAALVVTAFCVSREPGYIIVFSRRRVSFLSDEEGAINIVFREEDREEEEEDPSTNTTTTITTSVAHTADTCWQ